ncbi:MAG: hypothetical protein VKL59_13185 [Nostocaceae cyanobacterium]|nr:hypothetical protein [Nostocaceae cyanobacterium]
MVNKLQNDPRQRLEQFIQHIEEARKLQDDILQYGLAAAEFYFEDVDGDWWETWGENEEEEKTFFESVIAFLGSDDSVALKVRKQLKDKSLPEIAAQFEKCFNLPEEEEQIFAVKTLLVDSVMVGGNNRDYSEDIDEIDEIDLLDLAEELVEKLTIVREKYD